MNEERRSERDEERISELRRARGWKVIRRQIQCKERLNPAWLAHAKELRSKLGTGFFFALTGHSGTGKTQMAVDMMIATTGELLKPAEYTTATGFFLEIKSTYGRADRERTEKDVIDEFCRPQLLVIDEYEKRADTEWEQNLLFEVINRRYGMMLDTIVVSNLPADELARMFRGPLGRRVKETGAILSFSWNAIK